MDAAIAAEFAALGVAVTAELIEDAGPRPVEVWEANWRSVTTFLSLGNQWRVAATMGGLVWLGLDLGAARAVLERRNGRVDRRRLADLFVMEDAALPILNESVAG